MNNGQVQSLSFGNAASNSAAASSFAEHCQRAAQRVDQACRQAAAGKRAAQQVGRWAQGLYLNESEFRLLWLLARGDSSETDAEGGVAQHSLAAELAVSPAQLSACAARLACRGLVTCSRSEEDRRRQLCEATDAGRALVDKVIRELAPTEAIKQLKGEAA